jgi:AraC family transcriptional regulator
VAVFTMFGRTNLRLAHYAARTTMSPHEHEDASLNIVIGGGFSEKIGCDERGYGRGFVAFCPAGVAHSQAFGADGARQIIIRLQNDWLDYMSDCKLNLAGSPYAGSMLFRQLGDRLRDEMQNTDPFAAMACEGLVLEIVAAFGRTGIDRLRAAEPPAWLKRARDFLHAHAFTSLSMARVAEAAGRHEIHLAREFKRFFGLSVGCYVRRLRIERAAEMLVQSRADITDIALACGFASHSHLCREFKARYGVTPSQYRARAA